MSDEDVVESNSWLSRLGNAFGKTPKNMEQLVTLLRHIHKQQLIDIDSLRMIEGVLQIADMPVSEIMLPRAEIVTIAKDCTLEDMLTIAVKSGHSRFPVIGDNKDEVIGILLAKDLLNFVNEEERKDFAIKDILRPAYFIPENKRLNILLNEFRKNRNHIAIIVDEYGGVSGLVSIEDVIEQIVGNIEDEYDIADDIYIKEHKDNYYSIKATTPIEEFNKFFNTTFSDEEFDTIGGLVLQGFGHLPKRDETITIQGFEFKVLRANNRRIQVLQVFIPEKNENPANK